MTIRPSSGVSNPAILCSVSVLPDPDGPNKTSVLSDAEDHPDVEEVYRRASAIDSKISIATVYRTVRLFEDAGILERHDFGDGRARYEPAQDEHHDHLIDLQSGEVIEFKNEEIEKLQEIVARELGYKLVDHRLELYGIALDGKDED